MCQLSQCVQINQIQTHNSLRAIELVVRSEKGLTREVVKHLNAIEETVLESLAWESDSPVWTALQQYVVGEYNLIFIGPNFRS